MYYEINVAKLSTAKTGYAVGKYVHFFATSNRSITDKETLKEVYVELKKAFPEPQYNMTVAYCSETKEGIDIDELLKENQS
jgi:hypothetical protein